MKGLILCAGKGSRLQPFSYSQPKTLLPVLNKPVLEYIIENLIRQNIREIGIVIHPLQQDIRKFAGNGDRYGADIRYIYQYEPNGIAHAVKEAQGFIGGESFILMLGDNLIIEDLRILIDSFEKNQSSGSILLSLVDQPQHFGVAEIKGNDILSLEEKPKNPKSNLAVVGAYVYDPIIFEAIDHISVSARGEYEMTDAIQWLLNNGHRISYTITKNLFHDVGTPDRWLDANERVMENTMDGRIILGKNTVVENCTLKAPVIIGENCVLKNAEIGPFVSVQNDCRVENCKIDHSILLEKTTIAHLEYPVSHSIFGREVQLNGFDTKTNHSFQFMLGDKTKINRNR